MPNESTTRFDILGVEKEEVNYGSDTEFKPSTPLRDDRLRQTPNPFPVPMAADALSPLHMTYDMGSAIITNPLDEQQEQVLQ